MRKKIIIVEDDVSLRNGIVLALKSEDCEFIEAAGIREAEAILKAGDVDLVILDVNLPDGSGLEFLKKVKERRSVPVILLTANDMETDIVAGFELGADDYITKPFSLMVLRARVKVQLRKGGGEPGRRYRANGFSFDFDRMEYCKNGRILTLSKTEQKLLRILVENRGNAVSRGALVDKIWTDGAEYVDENALSVTVKRLRDKLEDPASGVQHIKTIYGIGYSWAEHDELD